MGIEMAFDWLEDYYCPKCEGFVYYCDTEKTWGCHCQEAGIIPFDDDGEPAVIWTPDYWVAPSGEGKPI